jgi:hypothetical protein
VSITREHNGRVKENMFYLWISFVCRDKETVFYL